MYSLTSEWSYLKKWTQNMVPVVLIESVIYIYTRTVKWHAVQTIYFVNLIAWVPVPALKYLFHRWLYYNFYSQQCCHGIPWCSAPDPSRYRPRWLRPSRPRRTRRGGSGTWGRSRWRSGRSASAPPRCPASSTCSPRII